MSQETKKVLSNALGELLKEKPLSKITISDITNKAGVNRHTFYYHFSDINDIIAWGFAVSVKDLLSEQITYDNWQKATSILLHGCVDRRKEVLAIYHSEAKEHILRLFGEWVYSLFRSIVEEQSDGMHVQDSDKEYIAHFYQYGFIGILNHWFDSGMMEDADLLLERLVVLIQGELKTALERFEKHLISE